MLAKFIVRVIFAAVGLWLACLLVKGVGYSDIGSLVLAAILLGVVNAFVRPVVFVLTLPLTIVTLGLFHTTFMYLLLYGAFQKASTSSLAVFGFVYPVVAVAVDFLAFGIVLHPTQWLGGVMILLAAGGYARGIGSPAVRKVA